MTTITRSGSWTTWGRRRRSPHPVPVLALLVLLKTAMDVTAHRREHT